MGFEGQDVERKVFSILRVLSEYREPVGARIAAQRLKGHGVELGERAVRYHLKLMDERGLTRLVGRDGRLLTDQGEEELRSALVKDKVGLAVSKINVLAFGTDFDCQKRSGSVPVNISFFPREKFSKALHAMRPAFDKGFCVSSLVAVAAEGERLGEFIVPEGKMGLATVSSVALSGALLKAGIPMESKFGGILQVRSHKPLRFVELIHYSGSSLDPSEVFIRARMTCVGAAAKTGDGKILANFREIPAPCRRTADDIVTRLKEARLGGLLAMGNTSAPVFETSVGLNRIGLVVLGGMNPVAAAEEAGFRAENHAMCTLMEYGDLVEYGDI
jgi:repressor of nif and glnA expression